MSPHRQRHARPRTPLALVAAGVLLLLAAIVWGVGASRTPTPPSEAALPLDPDDIPRVSLAEARDAFDNGQAVFLDVRQPDDFQQSHIPGALSIPLNELEARLGELDAAAWIITYCT